MALVTIVIPLLDSNTGPAFIAVGGFFDRVFMALMSGGRDFGPWTGVLWFLEEGESIERLLRFVTNASEREGFRSLSILNIDLFFMLSVKAGDSISTS